MIKVSILMYVKNGMPYFSRAIQSVMNQTLQDIEVIVIDGGSTDGTIAVVEDCMKQDRRVRLLHCDRGSVGAQFNMGVREAQGEYIGIVEADDYILPQMYEKEYLCAKENGCDVLRADNYIFFEMSGEEILIRTAVSHNLTNYGRNLSAENEPDKVLVGGSYWTGLYRREFLLEKNICMNETKGAAYQDFGFLFLTSVLADSVYFMKDAFYCYRKDNAMSSCNSPQGFGLVNKEFTFIQEQLKKRDLWDKYIKFYYLWKIRDERWFYKNLRNDMKELYIKDSHNTLISDLSECNIPDEEWNQKERDFICAIKSSEEDMRAYLMSDDERWKNSCEALERVKAEDKVYIFGAGNLGEIIRKYLESRDVYPKAFIDNNPVLWGTNKNGVKIISANNAVVDKTAKIIVCSENYAEEIQAQLMNEGLTEDKLIICNDMDSCIRFFMNTHGERTT